MGMEDLKRRCPKCKLRMGLKEIHLSADACVLGLQKELIKTSRYAIALKTQADEAKGLRAVLFILVRRNGGDLVITDAELENVSSEAELETMKTDKGLRLRATEPKPQSTIIQ